MRSALGFAALLFAATALAAPEHPAAWTGVAGATAETLDEPVFEGKITLYRAGPAGAEAVLLVHGLGPNGARDWGKTVPALAQRYEVFALDLPGFGASSKGDGLYTPENFARVIDKVVAPRVGRPFTLIGHSMGGAVALAYAGAYPQHLRRLVLVDMAGVLHGSVYAQSLVKSGLAQTQIPADAPWVDTLMGRMLTRIEGLPVSRAMVLNTPALRQKVFRGDPGMIAAYALAEHDFSDALRGVGAPTLVVWGADDEIAPLRTGQLAAALIPGARLHVFPGIGHAPQLQDPDRFNALLLEELQGRNRLAPYALPPGGAPSTRIDSCTDKANARFTGDFRKLTLIGCSGVRIENARIGELRVLESDVAVVNSEIREGLYALRSRIQLTAGVVAGAPALRLEGSDVDAAGTRFEGAAAIAANAGSQPLSLRLSVAELRRAGKAPRYVHEVVRLAPGAEW